MPLHLKAMGEKLEALMGEIKDDRESGRRRKADMAGHQKGHFARECPTNAMEGCSGNGQSLPSQ